MKRCPRCGLDLPLIEFGVMRARPDGLNLYCRLCCRQKVSIQRQKTREYRAAHKITTAIKRKPHLSARGIRRDSKRKIKRARTSAEKVLIAIHGGAETQRQIWSLTLIPKDEVSDALAELILDREAVKPRPLSVAERESWHGENWRYVAA